VNAEVQRLVDTDLRAALGEMHASLSQQQRAFEALTRDTIARYQK
jgi:hypothetical protein